MDEEESGTYRLVIREGTQHLIPAGPGEECHIAAAECDCGPLSIVNLPPGSLLHRDRL